VKTRVVGVAVSVSVDVSECMLLSCAREDVVVVLIIGVVGVDVSVGVDVVARAYSHSPPSVRAACTKLLKTPWEL
jgi:hypothetical protein